MNFHSIDFNSKWAATKTEDQFVAEFKDVHSLSEKQLKEAYGLCMSVEQPQKPAKAEKSVSQ